MENAIDSGRQSFPDREAAIRRCIRLGVTAEETKNLCQSDRATVQRIRAKMRAEHDSKRQFVWCDTCGTMVQPPCLACETRANRATEPSDHAKESSVDFIDYEFTPEHQHRYELLLRLRQRHNPEGKLPTQAQRIHMRSVLLKIRNTVVGAGLAAFWGAVRKWREERVGKDAPTQLQQTEPDDGEDDFGMW